MYLIDNRLQFSAACASIIFDKAEKHQLINIFQAMSENLLNIGTFIGSRANLKWWEVNCFYLTKTYKLHAS